MLSITDSRAEHSVIFGTYCQRAGLLIAVGWTLGTVLKMNQSRETKQNIDESISLADGHYGSFTYSDDCF